MSRAVRHGSLHLFNIKFIPFGGDLFGGQFVALSLHPAEMSLPETVCEPKFSIRANC
jgi:hypothetical protein